MWYSFLQFWTRIFVLVFFRIRVFGRENVPASGPVILAANHQSFVDPPLVGAGLNRQVHYMARNTLFERFFLFAWLIRSLNAYPVDRGRGDIGAVRETLKRLKRGAAIVVFPEATRTRTGHIGSFKSGIFLIAAKAGVPVVPTVIEGAFESWPRTRKLPSPYRVFVAFGEALNAGDYGANAQEMAAACRKRLIELQRETRARRDGHYADKRRKGAYE